MLFIRLLTGLLLGCLLPLTVVAGQVPVDTLLEHGKFEEAARRLEEVGDRESLLRAAEAWDDEGAYAPSFAAAQRTIAGPDGKYPADSLTALAYIHLGRLRYDSADDAGAEPYFQQALEIRDSLPGTSARDLAFVRVNLGTSLRYQEKYARAGSLFREAIDLVESDPQPDTLLLIRALNELGALAEDLQDLTIGRSSSHRATALAAAMVDLRPSTDWLTHYRAARILLRLGEAGAAQNYAQRSLSIAEAMTTNWRIADSHNMVGLTHAELDNDAAALESFLRAVAVAKRDERDEILGHTYLNLAEYYGERRNVAEFDKYRRRAREAFAAAGDLRPYYESDRIPGFLTSWGREREAVDILDERLTSITGIPADSVHLIDDEGMNTLELMPIIDLMAVRGKAYAGLDSTDLALRDYQSVFRMLGHLRGDVSSSASRGHLSKNLRPFYDEAIQLHYRRYRSTGDSGELRSALRLSEQSRAYSLLTALHTNRGDVSGEERELTARVADLERRVSLGDGGQQSELERTRLQLDRMRTGRKVGTPSVEDLSLDKLADHMRAEDCLLVEYHLSPSGSLVFVMYPDGELKAYPIESADSLAGRVERFRQSIVGGFYRGKSLRAETEQVTYDRQFLATGTTLVNQLLPPPLREALHQRPRLCIVPDGVLNYLPFAALPLTTGEAPLDYSAIRYLQDSARLHYAYSGQYLMELNNRAAKEYERDLLAFAPSFGKEGEATERRAANQLLRGGNSLGQLPFNRPEVEEILTLLANATAYFDADANRQHFLDGLGSSRVLHLSSHGSVNPTDPNLSFVAFTQVGDSIDRKEMLYFNDLYGMPIDNELTVLSACETALGELALGETTMSLASAFAAAGSGSTLTTLWEVDDRATKNLMVEFYRQLVAGASRSDALYAAQSDLRNGADYAHPYFWSAMTLYGASGPLDLEGGGEDDTGVMPTWSYAVTASLVISILAYFLLILKRSTATTLD